MDKERRKNLGKIIKKERIKNKSRKKEERM